METVTTPTTPIIRETLENIGGDVRVITEEDFALVRGWNVAGDPAVLAAIHEENARLKDVCKARFLKRYGTKG